MSEPRYTSLSQSLPATVPFVGPETQERARGEAFQARLGANENVFGPSPKAIAAMQNATSDGWMYGDPENHDLRQKLAALHAISPENIVVGEGIDGLLGYLVRLLIAPGDTVVTSLGAYPTFNYHVAGFGGCLEKVPYKEDQEDLDALIAKAHETEAKLIYFANPDNPMGSWHHGKYIEDRLAQIPDNCLLLLDEAYIEFAPEDACPKISIDHPKVIRMRTFSKAYGMAGLRIGYAMGAQPLIKSFDKIRNHFGVSRIAQVAALTALSDQSWLAEIQRLTETARQRIDNIAKENGLRSLPSATNFVAIDCQKDSAYAKAIMSGLLQAGIFVRMPFVAPQDRCIRVSCGRPEDLDQLAHALPQVIHRLG